MHIKAYAYGIIAVLTMLLVSCVTSSNTATPETLLEQNLSKKEAVFVETMGLSMAPMDHDGQIWSMAYSPDGTLLASAGSNGLLRIWSGTTGKLEAELKGHEGRIMGLGWSPDGSTIATSGEDGLVRVWNPRSQSAIKQLEGHKSWAASVAWSPDGKSIASGGKDGTVRIWNVASGKLLHTLKGHKEFVWPVVWHPEGNRIAIDIIISN